MGQYLVNFVAYTFAMIGLICLCLVIYKKCFSPLVQSASTEFLKVENQLNLSARKSIYVIKAGEEKFLIASDVDKTTFLAKLGNGSFSGLKSQKPEGPVLAGISIAEELKEKNSKVTKLPVMRELMRKLNS